MFFLVKKKLSLLCSIIIRQVIYYLLRLPSEPQKGFATAVALSCIAFTFLFLQYLNQVWVHWRLRFMYLLQSLKTAENQTKPNNWGIKSKNVLNSINALDRKYQNEGVFFPNPRGLKSNFFNSNHFKTCFISPMHFLKSWDENTIL